MLCKKCGKEIQDDANFCQYCGENIIEERTINGPIYNTLPIWKLITLLIISLSFYEIVWAYNLWKQGQKKYDKKISPFWRSIFCPITNFELYPMINDYITKIPESVEEQVANSGISKYIKKPEIKPFHAVGFATIYLVSHIVDRVLSRIPSQSQDFSAIDMLSFIPMVVIFSIIVVIQVKINKFNYEYNIPAKYDKWTWKTTGFIVLCFFVFFVYIVIFALLSNP